MQNLWFSNRIQTELGSSSLIYILGQMKVEVPIFSPIASPNHVGLVVNRDQGYRELLHTVYF